MISEDLARPQQQNLLCSLSCEVLEEILDYNVDVCEMSQACLLLRSLSEQAYKKKWDRLKEDCTDSYYIRGMVDAVELSGNHKPNYKSFRNIYKRLLELSGISPGDVRPEGVDATRCKALLDMDKRAREVQDKNLLLIWPRLYERIVASMPWVSSIIADKDSDVQKIRAWINDSKNLSILESIRKLELDSLGLTCLPIELSLFGGLRDLRLDYNKLEFVDSFVFGSMDLWELNLSNNQISELDPSIFKGVCQLYLSNNKLTKIDLSGASSLSSLSLSDNKLSKIDLSNASQLGMLDLSNNQLDTIDLSGLNTLYKLNLADNKLVVLGLPKAENLCSLNASRNCLSEIDLWDYSKLEEVNLSDNKLSSLRLPQLFGTGKLRILDLHNNSLDQLDIPWFQCLEWLDVGDNMLTSIEVYHLRMLENLNLKNNKLKKLDVPESRNLKWLDLSGNDLTDDAVYVSAKTSMELFSFVR